MSDQADLTVLLNAWSDGDSSAGDRLLELVYRELKVMSRSRLRSHGGPLTMQATELINEAYIRLARQDANAWQNRSHFFALAATVMQRVLMDHARRRYSQRRDRRLESDAEPADDFMTEGRARELLELDEALSRLETLSSRQARIVQLRYFGGLTHTETAQALDISVATVKRDWTVARAWLYRQLQHHSDLEVPTGS